MPDNWSFVAAAYIVAALVFGGYWRWLGRRERELDALEGSPARAARPGGPASGPRTTSPRKEGTESGMTPADRP
jgi:hypothetical protein